jgi:hypothetical protein
MKQAIFLPAVFLCLSATAQQTSNQNKNNLPAYQPVKFETLKKFKPATTQNTISLNPSSQPFTLAQPQVQSYNFKPLQTYLSEDVSYFQRQQKTKEWTQFTSSGLNSIYKQQWLDNKNNVQQRWMMQKAKGK